ncbi:MAG: hypothetical protein E7263_07980 [Lachnospiraceae bacterium]|nr:hypothetical protein [Lachnospiraceae bacterium]
MLYGWMKSLIIYLIFAGAIINMSPSGNYKKYIRFFTGIVAIIILMKPISYIFSFDESKLYYGFNGIDKLEEISGEDINYETIMDYYDLSITESIRMELTDRGFNVEAVEVVTDRDDKLLSCRVCISKNSELDFEFEENNIKKYVNEVYNLSFDNIYVVRR